MGERELAGPRGAEVEPDPRLGQPLAPADQERLQELKRRLDEAAATLVGYPCNERFDYSELFPFLAYSINNVGDPFASSNYRQNTHVFERELILELARLFHAEPESTWGYVTSGGTEGNLYGLYLARELYPKGIVYYSEDTHYSVAKSLRVLGVRSIMIKSQDGGEIDYEDLYETLKIHRDVPPILFANIGTTMKGATDDVAKLRDLTSSLRLKDSYIHCDAALSGMILPFVKDPPAWDFADGADSISVSGHKMLGCPVPSGVVLAKKQHVDRIARSIEYVGVLDTTIGGSRSALAPLFLWYAWKRLGVAGLSKMVADCEAVADYAIAQLEEQGVAAYRHPHSVTVVFPRPSPDVVTKWQIAPYKEIGHLIAMPHVTRAHVDAFVADYAASPPSTQIRCAVLPGAHVRHHRREG